MFHQWRRRTTGKPEQESFTRLTEHSDSTAFYRKADRIQRPGVRLFFCAFTQCQDNTHLFLKGNRPVEKTVIKAANDLNQARLMGNNAYRYMESKIIDCLS